MSARCPLLDGLLRVRHGHNRKGFTTPTYVCWRNMLQRCYDTNSKDFTYYGGRGITVCEEWKRSFEAFLRDMGEKPEGLTLGRRNNDIGYCKENCEWQTKEEQTYNKRNTLLIEFEGSTKSLAEWSKITGISYAVLFFRIKRGWPAKSALTRPVRVKR